MSESARKFTWSSRAWYQHIVERPRVVFGLYDEDDGLSGEMTMQWHDLGGNLCPCLHIYSDAWAVWAQLANVQQELAKVDGQDISEEAFVAILKRCGFQDDTKYEDPEQDKHEKEERAELRRLLVKYPEEAGR